MRTYLAPIGSFLERRIGLVILFLAVGIPLLLALLRVGLFDDKPTRVIISEVATGPTADAYVELYNDTDEPIDVKGWSVNTLSGTAELQTNTVIQPGTYLIIPSYPKSFNQGHPALAEGAVKASGQVPFAAGKGKIELLDASGKTVDSVSWPIPNAIPNAPPMVPRPSLVRRTQGLDSDDNSFDWRPGPATPSTFGLPTIRMPSRIFLLEVTNYVSLIGGFLLWAAFVLMGLIARRFETLTGQRTFWQAMVIAPVGILIYNLIQANGFFNKGSMTDCRAGPAWVFSLRDCEQLWSFVPLFIAACVMAYVVYLFYRISRRILEV